MLRCFVSFRQRCVIEKSGLFLLGRSREDTAAFKSAASANFAIRALEYNYLNIHILHAFYAFYSFQLKCFFPAHCAHSVPKRQFLPSIASAPFCLHTTRDEFLKRYFPPLPFNHNAHLKLRVAGCWGRHGAPSCSFRDTRVLPECSC